MHPQCSLVWDRHREESASWSLALFSAGGTGWWQKGGGAGGDCSFQRRSKRRRESLKVGSRESFSDGRIVSLCQCGLCRAGGGAPLLGEVHGKWEPAGSRVSQGRTGRQLQWGVWEDPDPQDYHPSSALLESLAAYDKSPSPPLPTPTQRQGQKLALGSPSYPHEVHPLLLCGRWYFQGWYLHHRIPLVAQR